MTCSPLNLLRRFCRDEDGNMMIEFVIFVPLLFTIFLTSVELGIYSMRQMWVEPHPSQPIIQRVIHFESVYF
jgi:hypothetical protein